MTFVLVPSAISRKDIVSDLAASNSTVELVSLEKNPVTINFLSQEGVLATLEGMVREILNVRHVRAKVTSVTVRKENDFGLFESFALDVVQVNVDIV